MDQVENVATYKVRDRSLGAIFGYKSDPAIHDVGQMRAHFELRRQVRGKKGRAACRASSRCGISQRGDGWHAGRGSHILRKAAALTMDNHAAAREGGCCPAGSAGRG